MPKCNNCKHYKEGDDKHWSQCQRIVPWFMDNLKYAYGRDILVRHPNEENMCDCFDPKEQSDAKV